MPSIPTPLRRSARLSRGSSPVSVESDDTHTSRTGNRRRSRLTESTSLPNKPQVPGRLSNAYGAKGTPAMPPRMVANTGRSAADVLQAGINQSNRNVPSDQGDGKDEEELPDVPEIGDNDDNTGFMNDMNEDNDTAGLSKSFVHESGLNHDANIEFVGGDQRAPKESILHILMQTILEFFDAVFSSISHGLRATGNSVGIFLKTLISMAPILISVALAVWAVASVQYSLRQSTTNLPYNISTTVITSSFKQPFRIIGDMFQRTPTNTTSSTELRTMQTMQRQMRHLAGRMDSLEYEIKKRGVEIPDVPYRRVNFFSTGFGAVVDPHLTSSTKRKPSTKADKVLKWWYSNREAMPPLAALEEWDDIGDCWCSPAKDGKVQIAILLPRLIYPEELIFEHMPSTATPDPEAAPQDIELWAELHKPITKRNPVEGLPDSYEKLGAWKYDIHSSNNIQSFHMDILDLKNHDSPTNKVIVRVPSNWGNLHFTCIYRMKLYGEPAVPLSAVGEMGGIAEEGYERERSAGIRYGV
ncbi:MAG: hypothetical protein M1834_005866 [Cirrosporium novae-zelandiae]|nr:MAG: hypothetical protein M1834_005866 [Cirrosporium novae-zelandiae]